MIRKKRLPFEKKSSKTGKKSSDFGNYTSVHKQPLGGLSVGQERFDTGWAVKSQRVFLTEPFRKEQRTRLQAHEAQSAESYVLFLFI